MKIIHIYLNDSEDFPGFKEVANGEWVSSVTKENIKIQVNIKGGGPFNVFKSIIKGGRNQEGTGLSKQAALNLANKLLDR